MPEEKDRGFCGLPQREDRPKVGVGRDDGAAFADGDLEDLLVGRGLHAEVSHKQSVVSSPNKYLCNEGRERVIYEEPQTGNGASNEWDLPLPDGFCSVA